MGFRREPVADRHDDELLHLCTFERNGGSGIGVPVMVKTDDAGSHRGEPLDFSGRRTERVADADRIGFGRHAPGDGAGFLVRANSDDHAGGFSACTGSSCGPSGGGSTVRKSAETRTPRSLSVLVAPPEYALCERQLGRQRTHDRGGFKRQGGGHGAIETPPGARCHLAHSVTEVKTNKG
jgi:hypothetical protein